MIPFGIKADILSLGADFELISVEPKQGGDKKMARDRTGSITQVDHYGGTRELTVKAYYKGSTTHGLRRGQTKAGIVDGTAFTFILDDVSEPEGNEEHKQISISATAYTNERATNAIG